MKEENQTRDNLEDALAKAIADLNTLDVGSKEREQKIREVTELSRAFNEYVRTESAYWTADEQRNMEIEKEKLRIEAEEKASIQKLELDKALNDKEIELKDAQIKMERNRFKLEIGKVILDVGVGAALWAMTLGFNAQYGSISTKDALRVIPKLGIKWK